MNLGAPKGRSPNAIPPDLALAALLKTALGDNGQASLDAGAAWQDLGVCGDEQDIVKSQRLGDARSEITRAWRALLQRLRTGRCIGGCHGRTFPCEGPELTAPGTLPWRPSITRRGAGRK